MAETVHNVLLKLDKSFEISVKTKKSYDGKVSTYYKLLQHAGYREEKMLELLEMAIKEIKMRSENERFNIA